MKKEIQIPKELPPKPQPPAEEAPRWLIYKMELEKIGIILEPIDPKNTAENQVI